jgi:myo-inositol 2-dehydrogenase / D-chiro-inositol 1-dehydrogenase
MTQRVRVGLIGTGLMGLEHIRNLKLFGEVEIVAIADPTPTSLAVAQALIDASVPVETYATADELVRRAKVDAVIIASPNHLHAHSLKPLMQTGIHVLCEKPLCSDLDDAKRVAELAAQRDAVFWVGMEYRFMPPAARFISEVHGGRVGRLQMLAMREHRFPFLPKVGDWNRFSSNTGGTMVEKCCHFFDLMRHIVQSDAVRVYCSGAMDVNHLDERYDGRRPDIIDNSYTIVDFANGVRAALDLCMFAEGSEHQEEIAAVGDTAKLEVFIPPGEIVFSPRVPLGMPKKVVREMIPVPQDALEAGAHFGATFYQQRAFLDAILHGASVQVTAEDGVKAVAIGTAAEISAREGRAVELAELEGASMRNQRLSP